MRVHELINQLQKMDPDTEIIIQGYDYPLEYFEEGFWDSDNDIFLSEEYADNVKYMNLPVVRFCTGE